MAPTVDEAAASDRRRESIEERAFIGCLMCIFGHFYAKPLMGPMTKEKVRSMLDKALKKTHDVDIRARKFGPNVELWLFLSKIFAIAVPSLQTRALGPESSDNGGGYPDSTNLIIKHYFSLRYDLHMLVTLMEIARNILICESKLVPQEICAAVHFYEEAHHALKLCVRINTIAKGPEDNCTAGQDVLENVIEIHELFHRLSVAAIQQLHNWVVSHNRNKMEFFATVLVFDEEAYGADKKYHQSSPHLNLKTMGIELENWLGRNSVLDRATRVLLQDHVQHEREDMVNIKVQLEETSPLACNWLAEEALLGPGIGDHGTGVWDPDEKDKVEQDRKYKRVSSQIDRWWEKVRDFNHVNDVKPMSPVEFAKFRQGSCREAFLQRCSGVKPEKDHVGPAAQLYGVGREPDRMPTDLLYRMTTILDKKQIEGLFRLVKTCVMDAQNDGDENGERYQKTRCRMLMALPPGRVLVQGLLDFVDMWDLPPDAEVYRQMRDIALGLHQNFLIPYTWDQFHSPSQLISSAQAVLLRLVTDIIRAGVSHGEKTAPALEKVRLENHARFFFGYFRTWVVPQYVAIMYVQEQIREGKLDAKGFPLTEWQMVKARTVLGDYLDLLDVLAQAPETRKMLIEWEAVHEFITLLIALDMAVPKMAMVPKAEDQTKAGQTEQQQQQQKQQKQQKQQTQKQQDPSNKGKQPASPDSSRSTKAHRGSDASDNGNSSGDAEGSPSFSHDGCKHTWTGIKGPIFTLIATLLQPTTGRSSPGNPVVQKQVLQHNGLPALLNCMSYDGHQPYARERVTLCLKWLVEGNKDASDWFRTMFTKQSDPSSASASSSSAGPGPGPGPGPELEAPSPLGPGPIALRVDGVGEVKVKIGSQSGPASPKNTRGQEKESMPKSEGDGGMTKLEEDFMA